MVPTRIEEEGATSKALDVEYKELMDEAIRLLGGRDVYQTDQIPIALKEIIRRIKSVQEFQIDEDELSRTELRKYLEKIICSNSDPI